MNYPTCDAGRALGVAIAGLDRTQRHSPAPLWGATTHAFTLASQPASQADIYSLQLRIKNVCK